MEKKRPSPYGAVKFTSVDEYHASYSGKVRQMLDEIRAVIHAAAPGATEVISYNMPAFKANKVLVYYAANKNHIGFYPTPGPIGAFASELTGYKTTKGAIQFPLDKELPVGLVRRIVAFRMSEDALLKK